jgi:hypothetical protein
VIGGVVAEDIVVRGRVVGSIRGLRVTLQAQSHVEGDIPPLGRPIGRVEDARPEQLSSSREVRRLEA